MLVDALVAANRLGVFVNGKGGRKATGDGGGGDGNNLVAQFGRERGKERAPLDLAVHRIVSAAVADVVGDDPTGRRRILDAERRRAVRRGEDDANLFRITGTGRKI